MIGGIKMFMSNKSADIAKGMGIGIAVGTVAAVAGGLAGALYGFDGRGAARVSFRVLPEHHCKGYGTSILEGLIAIARELSLTCLIGEVMIENSASIALMSRFAEGERNKDIITYKINL